MPRWARFQKTLSYAPKSWLAEPKCAWRRIDQSTMTSAWPATNGMTSGWRATDDVAATSARNSVVSNPPTTTADGCIEEDFSGAVEDSRHLRVVDLLTGIDSPHFIEGTREGKDLLGDQ